MAKKQTSEKVTEYKELKTFDLDMLRKVLDEKKKYGNHVHGQRKELIILRGDTAIKVLDRRDVIDSKKFQRKTKLLMLKV